MNNAFNNLRARITPECSGLANTVLVLGVVQAVILISVAILVLVTYLYYNSEVKTADGALTAAEVEKKRKKIKTMLIVAVVLEVVSVLVSLWSVLTSGKIKNCVALVGTTS